MNLYCNECRQRVTPDVSKETTPRPPKGRAAARIRTDVYTCPVCGNRLRTESRRVT